MKAEISIYELEQLTPGSTWVRSNGKVSRVLFQVNDTLPAEMQARYPRQVVYADENDNKFCVPLSDFLGKRTFYNVIPELEARVESLLAFTEDDSEPSFDLSVTAEDLKQPAATGDEDELLVVEDDAEQLPVEANAEPEDAAEPASVFPVSYQSGDTGLPMVLSPETLATATVSYEQEPMLSEGKLMHKLFIRREAGIDYNKLYRCFSPHFLNENQVYAFTVNWPEAPNGKLEVDWDSLAGIYPNVFMHEVYYVVQFVTNVELKYDRIEDTDTQEQVEEQAPAVQVAAVDTAPASPVVVQLVQSSGLGAPVEADNGFGMPDTPATPEVPVVVQSTITPQLMITQMDEATIIHRPQ